jgi:hypothetical protein
LGNPGWTKVAIIGPKEKRPATEAAGRFEEQA